MEHLLAAVLIILVFGGFLIAVIVWRSPPAEYTPDPKYGKCTMCGTLTVWNTHIRGWVHCDDRGAAVTCKTPREPPGPTLRARR